MDCLICFVLGFLCGGFTIIIAAVLGMSQDKKNKEGNIDQENE